MIPRVVQEPLSVDLNGAGVLDKPALPIVAPGGGENRVPGILLPRPPGLAVPRESKSLRTFRRALGKPREDHVPPVARLSHGALRYGLALPSTAGPGTIGSAASSSNRTPSSAMLLALTSPTLSDYKSKFASGVPSSGTVNLMLLSLVCGGS